MKPARPTKYRRKDPSAVIAKRKAGKVPPPESPKPQWPYSVTKEYYERGIKAMPKGAIKADLTKHAPHNSYCPPLWYVDELRKCVVCDVEFTFTARQQQRWFEVYQIPIYITGNHCAACRRKRREALTAQKQHMAEMAERPPHPNEAFFRKKTK